MPTKNVSPKIGGDESVSRQTGAFATIGFFSGVAAGAFALLSLSTFDLADPGWSSSGGAGEPLNQGGIVGAFFADVTFSIAGIFAHAIPLALLFFAYRQIRPTTKKHKQEPTVVSHFLAG